MSFGAKTFGKRRDDGKTAAQEAQEEVEDLRGIVQRTREEERRRKAATDSEFWVCVCFHSREAKEAWLRAKGMLAHGDKYLDGHKLARFEGVDLPSAGPSARGRNPAKRWVDLASAPGATTAASASGSAPGAAATAAGAASCVPTHGEDGST